MGLRTVTGAKRPADYSQGRQANVKDPLLLVYSGGKAQASVRCADLVSVTGVTDPGLVHKVTLFAENVPEDKPWTKEHVAALCQVVGRQPFPKYVAVEHLVGQGALLLQVATQKDRPGVTELNYGKRTNRPSFNILPVLKKEEIEIPEGMCLEVPVSLILDEGALKVEANLRMGVQRTVKVRSSESEEAEATGEAKAETKAEANTASGDEEGEE